MTVTSKTVTVHYTYKDCKIKVAPHPFSEGSQRLAYFGVQGTHGPATVVLKTFKYEYEYSSGDGRDNFLNMVETQAISKYFTDKFNSIKPSEAKEITFLDVKIVEVMI